MRSKHQNGIVTGNGALTEQALRASELSYRRLFEAAKDGILILDIDTGRISDVNPFLIDLLGFSHSDSEMVGKTVGEVGLFKNNGSNKIMFERLQKDGYIRCDDLPLETRDGRKIAVELIGNVYQAGDKKMIQCHIRDITGHKRVEESLRQSEERYRGLFEHLVEGYAYCKMIFENGEPKDWTYLSVNRMFEKLTGLKGVAGKRVSEVIPRIAETDPELFKIYARVSLTGKAERFEFFVQALQQWFDISVYSPEKEFFVAVFDVITDRKRAEEALRDSEQLFRNLAESVPQLVWMCQPDGMNIYFNQQWVDYTGLTLEESYGQGWNKPFHPDDRQRARDAWQAATTKFAEYSLECRLRRADGEYRWWLVRGVPLRDAAGKVLKWFGTCTDIHESKLAAENLKLFRALIERSNDAIHVVDPATGRFLDVNESACRSLGYTRDEHLALTVFDVVEVDRAFFLATIERAKKAGHVTVEVLHRRKDGTTYPVEVSLSPITIEREYLLAVVRDITERKRAEEAVREGERRFQTLADTSPVGIFWTNAQGQTTYVNPRWCQITGLSETDALGDGWLRAVHPDDRERLAQGWNAAIQAQNISQTDYRFVHPDGTMSWVMGQAVPEKDDAGRVVGYVGTITDITERKRAEEALRDSEEKYRRLFDSSKDAFMTLAPPDWRFTSGNASTVAMFRAKDEAEFVSKAPWELSPERQPDGRLSTEKAKAMIEQAMREGNHYFEWTHKRLDGEEFPATVLLTRLELQGRMLLNACVRDITERKRVEESQARLATAVEQAAETIMITDTRGTILYVNPAFEKTSGYTRAEALGQNPRILKSGKQDAEFYRRMWEALGRGETWSGHFINRRKDGVFYEEEATISPVRDAAGTIVNYTAVKRDVTRETQLEAQFRQAQKMEAVGQLAGGVAHDFNNILGVIIGYGDLITEDLEPDSPLRTYAEEIRQAAVRATGLTRQLLVFSRKQKVELVVLDLNDTVKNLDKMLRRLIGENIEMTVVPGKEIGRIKADSGYIGQVLMNLAVNARDAMPNGGKLTIATDNVTLDEDHTLTHKDTTPGDYVMLTVSDTGTGMTPEVKARIFEALFTTKPAGKGTGLGLATCQAIVQQSGGHIDVASEVGKGTTFKIYFPRIDKPVGVTAGSDQTGPLPRGTETLLVVEDEPSVRHLAWKVLAALGYQVLRANNGQDALHLVHEHKGSPIRLVVTDVMMPVMGGKVMADWLKATYPDLKILFTSGYTDDAIAQQGVLEPGVAFLPKPYTPGILARKVRAMLDNETDTAQLRKQGAATNQPSPGST